MQQSNANYLPSSSLAPRFLAPLSSLSRTYDLGVTVGKVVAPDCLNIFGRGILDANLALVNEGGEVLLVDFAPWLWIVGISRQSWHWAKAKIMAGEREVSVVACCLAPCSVLSAQGFFL